MSKFRVCLALCLIGIAWTQQNCDIEITAYFDCKQNAHGQGIIHKSLFNDNGYCSYKFAVLHGLEITDDHEVIRQRINDCFQDVCTGTPADLRPNFPQPGGGEGFPESSQYQCLKQVKQDVKLSCQNQLGINFDFPEPKHGHHGPGHWGHHGHGSRRGGPGSRFGGPDRFGPGGPDGVAPGPEGFGPSSELEPETLESRSRFRGSSRQGRGRLHRRFGRSPHHGGHGGGHRRHGPPSAEMFQFMVSQMCPVDMQEAVLGCVQQITSDARLQHENKRASMEQCRTNFESTGCDIQLETIKAEMCTCMQSAANQQVTIDALDSCGISGRLQRN